MQNLTRWLNSPDALKQIDQERARRSLLNFTKYTFSRYVADPAHELIAGTLDRIVSGELKRVMIFAPPQSGKSELVSIRLPAYWLGKRAHDPIIIASYGASLAHRMSRRARDVVESLEYADIFSETKVSRDVRARNLWQLENGTEVVAAGVGGPVTGHGAVLAVCDDPFENWEQAQSETIRNKVWDWWRGTFRPRVWENGAIILIMTRWHVDDLAGRLLQTQGDRWTVLRLPAQAETQKARNINNAKMGLPVGAPDPLGRVPGEALCPSRFSVAALREIHTDVGSMVWSAEYQASPTQAEGNRFKRAWFTIVDAAPADVAGRGRYWDVAATDRGGAASAGILMSIDNNGIIHIEDAKVGHWSSGERNKVMKQVAQLDHQKYNNYGRLWFEEEPGSSGKDASASFMRLFAGLAAESDRATGDKDVRLEPFAAQAEAGNVRLVHGPWNGAYIEEMCAVPNGKLRDQADATAGGYNKLAVGGVTIGVVEIRR